MSAPLGWRRAFAFAFRQLPLALLLHGGELLLALVVVLPLDRTFAATFGASGAGATTAAGGYVGFAWHDWQQGRGDAFAAVFAAWSGAALIATVMLFTVASALAFARAARVLAGHGVATGPLALRFLRLLPFHGAALFGLALLNQRLGASVTRLALERLGATASANGLAMLLLGKTLVVGALLALAVAATGVAKGRLARGEGTSATGAWLHGLVFVLRHPLRGLALGAGEAFLLFVLLAVYALLRDQSPALLPYLLLTQALVFLRHVLTLAWVALFVGAPERPHVALEAEHALAARRAAPRAAVVLIAGAWAANATRSATAQVADVELPAGPLALSYVVDVTLDAAHGQLAGSERITLRHSGTAPLRELRLQLPMNAYADGGTALLRARRLRLGRDPLAGLATDTTDATGAIELGAVTTAAGAAVAVTLDETAARLVLPEAVAPGAMLELRVEFVTRLPALELSGRGGRRGDHYDGFDGFPRLDLGAGAELGEYDVALTVPEAFVVGATGREVETTATAIRGAPAQRHRFVARAVRDFAWCADPHFVRYDERVELAAGHVVTVHYLCPPFAVETAPQVLAATRSCLQRYAEWGFPDPCDTLTIAGRALGSGESVAAATFLALAQEFPAGLPWLRDATEEPFAAVARAIGDEYWSGKVTVAGDDATEARIEAGVGDYLALELAADRFDGGATSHARPGRLLPAAEWRNVVRPFLNRGLAVAAFGARIDLAQLVGFAPGPFAAPPSRALAEKTLLGFLVPLGDGAGLREERLFAADDDDTAAATRVFATLARLYGTDALRAALQVCARRHRFVGASDAEWRATLAATLAEHAGVAPESVAATLHELWDRATPVDLAVSDARSMPLRVAPGAPIQYQTEVVVENRGGAQLGAPIVLRFADGHEERHEFPATRRRLVLTAITGTPLVSAAVDPDHRLAVDPDWTNNERTVAPQPMATLRLDAAALFWIENAFGLLRALTGP